eukprot:g15020.t1
MAVAIDFPIPPLRRYLWDHLSEILHPDENQQRRRPPPGLSSTWAAGTGHEGFDGFRIELKKFSSGQSNPTFLLVVHLSPPPGASPSGKTTSKTTCRFVLRKKPASVKVSSAHAVEREFRILRALRLDTSSNVPVPRALLLCEDTAVIGTAFYVMEFVQGRIFSDAALPGMRPGERAAIYESAAETLARLHRVDFVRAGLGGFGRAKGGYLGRQVATLERVATKQAEDAGPIEGFAEVVHELQELTAPGSNVVADCVTIVHGDFRIDNLVFHPAEPRVIAVLDWELSTLGHPLADLANLCILHHLPASAASLAPVQAPPRGPRAAGGSGVHAALQPEGAEASASAPSPSPSPLAGLKGLDLDALGIPQQWELMNAYRRAAASAATAAAASGRRFGEHQSLLAGVDGPGVAELGLAFVFFKMAVIAHGVKARQSRGVASSAQASLVSAMVPEMIALATEQISKLRAIKAGEKTDRSGGGGEAGGGGGEKQGPSSRRCKPSVPLPLPPPKAVLFDVGGVLSGSPLLAIAEFERETQPSLPPSYVGVAIAAAGEGGLFQRLERGEERLGERFLERFAEYLCSDHAKRAYVDWYVARWAAGKGEKVTGKRRPLPPPMSSTAASQRGEPKTSSPPRTANDVINRSECEGESSSSSSSNSSSSSARGEATAAVASVVAVDALELFRRITEAAQIPVPEMFAAAEALRRQGFKVGVVSNDFLVERGFVLERQRRPRGPPEDEEGKLAAASGMRLSERAEQKDKLEAPADAVGGPEVGDSGSSSSSRRSGSSGVVGDVYSRLPALCDAVVLSSRSRCRKPGDAIYRRACKELGVSASEVVFVDDIRINIQAAGALGMRTVWVEPGGSVDAAVSELEAVTGVRLTALSEAGASARRPAGKL